MHSIPSLNVVDLMLDAVCLVNVDSTIVFVSPAFERIFGYQPDEVVGKRMLDMVHPDDLAITQRQAKSVTEGNLQLQFENRYLRKDGTIAHIRWTARWLPEQQVRLAVAHDITERRLTESMQAVIYAISEAAHTTQNLQALFQHIALVHSARDQMPRNAVLCLTVPDCPDRRIQARIARQRPVVEIHRPLGQSQHVRRDHRQVRNRQKPIHRKPRQISRLRHDTKSAPFRPFPHIRRSGDNCRNPMPARQKHLATLARQGFIADQQG